MFLEVVRGQQPYQCFGRLERRQQRQASNLRTSSWPSTAHGLEMAAMAPRPKQHEPELLSVTIKYQRGCSAVSNEAKPEEMTTIKVLALCNFPRRAHCDKHDCVESACEPPCQPEARPGHCLGQERPSFSIANQQVKKKPVHLMDTFLSKW